MRRGPDFDGAECKILRVLRVGGLGVFLGCGVPEQPDQEVGADATVRSAAPADSLVLEVGGASVWHTLSREATGPDGKRCFERTLEIRRDRAPPVRVPLLYTRDEPRVIDDSTLEARVFLNCAPGDRYRIDMRTGQPTRIR